MSIGYDQLAPNYDRAIHPLERRFLNKLRRQAFAQLPSNARILELGAGTGLNFIHYRADAKGVATEPSKAMIQIAQTKCRPSNIALVQNCAEQLPFANSSFDAAIATLVLCSVRSPQLVFQELRRVVRQQGTIVLLEHVRPNGMLGRVFDLVSFGTVRLFDDHFNRRTAEVAATSGLEVVEITKFAFGIMNLIRCRV